MPKSKKTKIRAKEKIKKKDMQPKAEPDHLSKPANFFVIIAVFLLAFYGIISVIIPNSILNLLKENFGPNTTLTVNTLITYGIVWIILAFLMALTNKEMRKKADKSWTLFLLVLSIVAIVLFIGKPIGALAVLAGILTLTASIMYLTKK